MNRSKVKTGVYVCHCGTNIAATVDVVDVARFARELEGVVVARDYTYMCSNPGQDLIKQDIKEYGLNRIVVASCSPLMHEPTFRQACADAGLNPFFCQMANIREQCSWVINNREQATIKARALVRAAVARVRHHDPLEPRSVQMTQSVLVVGGGIAGIEASLRLAEAGKQVYLVERDSSIGGHMGQLYKTFPTMDCAACILTPKMVSVGRHPNITLLSYSEVEGVSGYVGNYTIRVRRKARYVKEDVCAGCGQCAEVCPVEVVNPFEIGLSKRKAVYRNTPQAVPGAYAIEKRGVAPCRAACPTDQRAEGYIALIHARRYADAYWAIRREHPFPSICGRVCNHPCEEACTRSQVDQPVSIMALKRFVADWAYAHRDELPHMRDKSLVGTPFQHHHPPTGKKVAVIGAGPAGLTAGLDLVRLGHKVTVFDALPVAGGMMRVGIPPHRLPYDRLDWEVQQIVDEGVELRLNTRVDDIPSLFQKGYDAVVVATGAHSAQKLNIPGSDHPDNWLSLDLLRRACLGEPLDLSGREIVVLGAGDVALDSARTAIRLGQPKVKIVCRGMRASFNELHEAEAEGVEILKNRVFKEIVVRHDKIVGVMCLEAEVGGIVNGQRQVREIPGTEHIIPCDMVIWALGQRPDFSFLPEDGSIAIRYPIGLWANEEMMTTRPGVFAAGDLRRGTTFFVVDAIAEGHRVARCVDRYLHGSEGVPEPVLPPKAELSPEEIEAKFARGEVSRAGRIPIRTLPPEERVNNFREVDQTMTEEEALAEAARCLRCGICSECLECEAACERGAIDHNMQDETVELTVGAIILATGFRDFDPARAPELNYGKLDNILTALQFERLINSGGPTQGKVLLKNGKPPKSIAIVHCVGSRDHNYNDYCSRVCCMYSLKLAHMAREYLGVEVHEIYRDIRAFGKGYEEFYKHAAGMGVHFYHGRIQAIEQKGAKLRVRWNEAFHGQPSHVDVDMVVLATGFEPQADVSRVASLFGVSRSADGFFLERHPKLAPVETVTQGIYLAGACQGPKDIPDSVAQAGAAAAAALSLLDQGAILLDPIVAEADPLLCAGCGQCAAACPYGAIAIEDGAAKVNVFVCKGCGTCTAACPNKAMNIIHFNDRELVAELLGALADAPLEVA
ncbi:MAG: FAD-dependent oxidoreductase [Anaerolineales bacterium]